ncbi:PREDICTED: caspase-1-like [Amphimedon queenslandica]|uniref:Caspase family p20 domain-containing protein n=1 Tax=Amphimedon queenslandica TaxID=400682 RepID=A0AAN0IRR0_AMPQE|nr:PREDICTED: caspase-1-like [Amphimedon queenslandica]|eukprot:XP_011407839.1 PREDICTED: caspase-1-like [Amphimedon queenslandica]
MSIEWNNGDEEEAGKEKEPQGPQPSGVFPAEALQNGGPNWNDDSSNLAPMQAALKDVEQQLSADLLTRYRLAVAVVMEGNKADFTDGKNFRELFEILGIQLKSYQSAITLTIEVLKGSRLDWKGAESLQSFASIKSPPYVLDPDTDLCVTIYKFYNGMTNEEFDRRKCTLFSRKKLEIKELDRCDFVIWLKDSGFICVGDVSQIEGDTLFFDEYKEKYYKKDEADGLETIDKSLPEWSDNANDKDTSLPSIDEKSYVVRGKKIGVKNDQVYEMNNSKSPGYCLVISIDKNRPGNEEDLIALKKLFQDTLKFSYKEYKNVNEVEINKLLENLEKANHSWSSCFVMFILAHGDTDKARNAYFTAGNEEQYRISTIKAKIERINGLCGQPKLFFIQSCRGEIDNTGLARDSGNNKKIRIPIGSDFLLSFATIERFAAYRSEKEGTVFIQSLCKVFEQYCKTECDVVSMMTIIAKKIADEEYEVDGLKVKQIPEFSSTLRRFLYLQELVPASSL